MYTPALPSLCDSSKEEVLQVFHGFAGGCYNYHIFLLHAVLDCFLPNHSDVSQE